MTPPESLQSLVVLPSRGRGEIAGGGPRPSRCWCPSTWTAGFC